ncbi:nucleotide-binding universal stress UspA family protein [Ulvibacter sp. MAR_2010_11]|uniref:universal stress protein n=1 Tax=Ulvibacter sp. MAR_2010_11 TaxID=1250229 RepID=UPI000C2CCE18|nr:universal stress protein [Ulvibacter sp. MAR_2010_11]PKA84489.1 nucleotide-binding universal stress UspA family protein [Ulvibacter sp. MAR_2010_11]
MKKKIVLPTDFSKNAWNALRYSSELYKNEDVDFYLLNAFSVNNFVLDNMMVPEPGEKWYEEAKLRSELGLKKILKQIEILDVPSNHTYFIKSVFSTPLEAVISFVEEKDIDMVISSSKGETDDLDTIMGSNSIDFMEKVRNCPVLMIPKDVSFQEPNEIVFPTSFKTHYKRKELNHLYEIAKITNAPIRILHISKKNTLTKEQEQRKVLLEECFDGLKYTFHFLHNTEVQTGLNIFTQSRNSGMIAFINKKHSFFGSIFSKPMVKDLGFSAKVPVLALHDLRN